MLLLLSHLVVSHGPRPLQVVLQTSKAFTVLLHQLPGVAVAEAGVGGSGVTIEAGPEVIRMEFRFFTGLESNLTLQQLSIRALILAYMHLCVPALLISLPLRLDTDCKGSDTTEKYVMPSSISITLRRHMTTSNVC